MVLIWYCHELLQRHRGATVARAVHLWRVIVGLVGLNYDIYGLFEESLFSVVWQEGEESERLVTRWQEGTRGCEGAHPVLEINALERIMGDRLVDPL